MDFFKLLKLNSPVFLDGALGTVLMDHDLPAGENPSVFGAANGELLYGIHKSYVESGAQVICANTFSANSVKLRGRADYKEVIKKSVDIAKKACGTKALTALDIGPCGYLLEPAGSFSFEEAYNIFKQQIEAGKDADIIFLETFTDLLEIKAALLAAKENSSLPVICSMSFEKNGRTFTGCDAKSAALMLTALGADVIGVNCAQGPEEIFETVRTISEWTTLPIAVKPNAGLPDPITGRFSLLPDAFANGAEKLLSLGVKLFGGCCGTAPEHIAALHKRLNGKTVPVLKKEIPPAVCSMSRTVVLDTPLIIGERINPTGKPLFKEALKNGDLDYILKAGIEQSDSGAHILDVNVGMPGTDECKMMRKAVLGLQSVTDTPLQLDSTDPEVLEAALRIYSGKPVVNSVNGDGEVLRKILPLCKKYGAAVVGLTLDEKGIPKTAESRVSIAEKIIRTAEEYGIDKKDVYIDCLTLTASAEQDNAKITLEALKEVKKLGVKTVLGVSNVSFGLPDRERLNSTFLTMALAAGLDLAIINPNSGIMTGALNAFNVLANIDKGAAEYIKKHSQQKEEERTENTTDLIYAIEKGLKSEAREIAKALLKIKEPMLVVDGYIIPALDRTGELYDKGSLYLPQLLGAAAAAQAAFEEIRLKLAASGAQSDDDKKVIVLATVKGDIHDIGKNIVKVILQNYGYNVIDLGKDVSPEEILNTVLSYGAGLVGLSALMTTTLGAMEETVRLLNKRTDCKIMVGGAVLTPDYAEKIGADFYGADAREAVEIARRVFK